MNAQVGTRTAVAAATCALALSLIGTAPSHAGPGDWANVSGIPSGSNYPEISTSAVPSVKLFGNQLQVAWSQADSANAGGIYLAALNANGAIARGAAAAVTGGRFNGYPQLLSYQGQRALSFGGFPAGTSGSRGQNLATSSDGVNWTLNPGSLSATNLADVSSGGGTVEAQSPAPNTLIWAGAPNMGSVTWHVGLSATNPADTADGRYDPPAGQSVSAVNVVYEASSQKTFAGFYNSSAGTFFGEIAPNYAGFGLVPGSEIRSSDGAGSPVPMAARAQGGVFIAFSDPAGSTSSSRSLVIREMNSGRTWTIPGSEGAEQAAMDAAPNGRVWVTYEKSGEMYIAHTDPDARDFGAPRAWGTPERGATIYQSSIEGDASAAYIGINTFARGEQNIYVTPVQPNLTVDVVGRAKPGATVKLRIRDGGAPVRNARVKVANRDLKSGKGGLVKFTAPRSGSVKVTVSGPGYATSSRTISLR